MSESNGSGVAPAALAVAVAQGKKAVMRRLLTVRHHRHGRQRQSEVAAMMPLN